MVRDTAEGWRGRERESAAQSEVARATQGSADVDVTEGKGKGMPAEGAKGPGGKGLRVGAGEFRGKKSCT